MARYVEVRKLGAGGMGTVYLVRDTLTGRELAQKRIIPKAAEQDLLIEAFEREYQVLASLEHPRIIRVFDYGKDALGPYYTMELIEGQDLRDAAPLPIREACLYLRDVATSLALLHARRFIHRDVTPGNVRKTRDGHCKLLDFGALMPFGRPETVVGTPPVVPPEAFEYALLDQRADIYSLGALAYWLLTKQHAYPARELHDLPDLWARPLVPPSTLVPGIAPELDHLVCSMLSLDPLARPDSVAQVIALLTVVGELPEEESRDTEQLALSFLLNPRFTGRTEQIGQVQRAMAAALEGTGSSVYIEAASGTGRTRLLEEITVRAQLAGMTVLRADASAFQGVQGTSRALVLGLFEAAPQPSRELAPHFLAPLRALGHEVQNRIGAEPAPRLQRAGEVASLEGLFAEISRSKPLAILVDNIECADGASLGLLASLAKLAAHNRLLIVATKRADPEISSVVGLSALRSRSTVLEMPPFSADELLELTRSLFDDAPGLRPFNEWLHGRTAGSPLHALSVVRQLISKQRIRHSGGVWSLPLDRPDAALPAALEETLSTRVSLLGDEARTLAECLSLQQEQPSLELCRLLSSGSDDRQLFAVLAELAQHDVLYSDRNTLRFSSLALRDVLASGMDAPRLQRNHRRLGEAFAKLAERDRPELQLEAGWHLIQGGDELRGADLIADVAKGAELIRTLLANLYRAGHQFEAALLVYIKHGRSAYERLPLLSSLAQAGHYEDRVWAERYGEAALDQLSYVCGLHSVRRLRPFLGRRFGLYFGMLLAMVRFLLVPREQRRYSFASALQHLFGAVTALTGTAALTLDGPRTDRTAETLEPFSVLSERLAPVGIYQFCKSLAEITRDNQAIAYENFERMLRRFEDPSYYRALPDEARPLYVAATHFARGSFAVFRAHGRTALESADVLERTGLKLYAMIASQLRFLYYMNRGEFAMAASHREQVDLHAAHVGSLWQVETWESPALIPVYTTLSEIVAITRVAHRLEFLSQSLPSLERYSRLAGHALMRSRGEPRYAPLVAEEYQSEAPRSYIGWGVSMAFLARGYNEIGQHAEAKRVCEKTRLHITDADREYVLFLGLDIQLAIADAGLGYFAEATARIDALIERFEDCDHPLVQGLLHEVRARIHFAQGNVQDYEWSRAETERWFLPTQTPSLIAKCRRLAELKQHYAGGAHALLHRDSIRAPSGAVETPDDPELCRTRTLCLTATEQMTPHAMSSARQRRQAADEEIAVVHVARPQ